VRTASWAKTAPPLHRVRRAMIPSGSRNHSGWGNGLFLLNSGLAEGAPRTSCYPEQVRVGVTIFSSGRGGLVRSEDRIRKGLGSARIGTNTSALDRS